MTERVGIVGMGLMGQAFIHNMRKSQFIVQGYDVDAQRMDDLKNEGGHPVDTPAEAAKGVKFLITSLPTSSIVGEVVNGANGILEGAEEGLCLCDTTTSRPEDSIRLSEELAGRGIKFLDSAVSGTSAMARVGDLIVIAGGDKEDFEACRPIFSGFSRAAYYMGPVGSGARTKLVINLILGGNRLALAEGLVLGEKMGLGLDNLLEVVKDGACGSKTMVDKGPKMIKADFSKEGTIKTSVKDRAIMIEEAQRFGAPIPLTSTYTQIVQAALQKGYGEKDAACLIEILRGMAGLEERIGIDDEPFGNQ